VPTDLKQISGLSAACSMKCCLVAKRSLVARTKRTLINYTLVFARVKSILESKLKLFVYIIYCYIYVYMLTYIFLSWFSLYRSGWWSVSANAKDIITSMINVDPSKRSTATEALNHKWIKTNCSEDQ